MKEKMNAVAHAIAHLHDVAAHTEAAHASGRYTVQCHDADGVLLWEEPIENLVTTVGGNFALDTVLSGSAYTAAWYIGLITATSFSAVALGDTMASHAGWLESVNYSQSTRVATAWNSAASKSKSLSAGCVFTMNATDTIQGCFLTSISTKSGATGTLYSAGTFATPQPVVSGNTLTVSYTASI